MTTHLLPTAEHVLEVGVRRAREATRNGAPVEDVARVLVVAGYAAELLDRDAVDLDDRE